MRRHDHNDVLHAALDAAERDERSLVVSLVEKLGALDPEAAKRDEAWLIGESAYIRAQYRSAIRAFARFDRSADWSSAPLWQRYRSLHRQAFSHLQLGAIDACLGTLHGAEDLLDAHPELAARRADVLAMRGHIAEIRGDFASAIVLMKKAHEHATAHFDWHRAATTASDLGRIFGILGELVDAQTWITTAETMSRRTRSTLIERTIAFRRSAIEAAAGDRKAALRTLDELILAAADGQTPELAIDARAQSADLLAANKDWSRALERISEAVSLARERALQRHLAYGLCAQASYLLQRGEAKDVHAARTAFSEAVSLACALTPRPVLLLVQLARRVIEEPRLVDDRVLPIDLRSELERAIEMASRATQPLLNEVADQASRERRASERLAHVLKRTVDTSVVLDGVLVNHRTGVATFPDGAKARLSPSELALLDLLVSSWMPLSVREIAASLSVSNGNASRLTSRLREKIGDHLDVKLQGRLCVYSVRCR